MLNQKLKEDGGLGACARMRRRSLKERVGLLANGEIGVFSLCPLTIHQQRQKASYNINLLPIKYVVSEFSTSLR
jgi:hypothetical protein